MKLIRRNDNMAENLYDIANNLESNLRQSEQYNELKNAYQVVKDTPASQELFDKFRMIQLELQQKQMQGQEITETEVEAAQKLAQEVQGNEHISALIESEQRMSVVINDLNEIITGPLRDLYQDEAPKA